MSNVTTARPNLFDFATSELSQDAFICWLASWAKPDFKETDPDLNIISRKFLSALIDGDNTQGKAQVFDNPTINVKRQYQNIDVLITIKNNSPENSHVILIEDKTGTRDHGEQLKKYRAKIEANEDEFLNWNVHAIYFHTGDEGNSNRVKELQYKPFDRKDFLEILRQGEYIQNEIFRDYADRLDHIENLTLGYKTNPVRDWNYQNWQGFFRFLCDEINKTDNIHSDGEGADFFHVPNQSGGFLACIFPLISRKWSLNKRPEIKRDIYCQLEVKSLQDNFVPYFTVRLSTGSKEATKAFRDEIRPILTNLYMEEYDPRLGNRLGKSSCILVFNDIIQVKANGMIDLERTLNSIEVLRETAEPLREYKLTS